MEIELKSHEPGVNADADAPPGIQWARRFDWERCIRRCRLGFYDSQVPDPKRWVRHSTVQHVALTAATYADLDGTRIRPSVKRLAMVCELNERTVRACLKRLCELHLLVLVTPARSPGRCGGPGRAAEYRMAFPEDLLDLVAYLDPDEQRLIVPPAAHQPLPYRRNARRAAKPVDDPHPSERKTGGSPPPNEK